MVNRNNHALDANDNDNVTITGDLIILAEEEEDLDEEEEFGNTAWQHDLFILSYFRILFYFFVPLKERTAWSNTYSFRNSFKLLLMIFNWIAYWW